MRPASSGEESKEALLFEKRSKHFLLYGIRVAVTRRPQAQKFFGSFFQKKLLLPS
jgi:hypothetical protein